MLTDEQRRQIEMAEADRIRSELIERREQWGRLNTHRLRGLMDDLRSTIVEEPWFGKSVSGRLNDVSRMVHEPDLYSLADGIEKARIILSDLYGPQEPEVENQIQESDLDHER